MRTKIFILGTGMIVWATMVILALRANTQTKALVVEAEGLRLSDAAVRSRLVQAQQRLSAAESSATALPVDDDAARSHFDIEIERRKARVRERRENDPEFQVRYVAQQVDSLNKVSLPFFRARKLSPEQIERLRSAWMNSRLAQIDIEAVRKQQQLSTRDTAIRAQQAQVMNETLAIEKQVLGVEGMEAQELWNRSLAVRGAVERFAGKASLLGESLTFDQADELVAILAESDPGYRKGGRAAYNQINWEAAAREARAVLTPAQQTLFAVDAANAGAAKAYQRELVVARRIKVDAERERQ